MVMDADETPYVESRWSWLAKPWVLLFGGGVLLVVLSVGLFAWHLHQRETLLSRIEMIPGVSVPGVRVLLSEHLPDWLQPWLPDAVNVLIPTISTIYVERPISLSDFQLLNQWPGIEYAVFSDLSAISDDELLSLIERQPLINLNVREPRRLTSQQLNALTSKPTLVAVFGLKGPFDAATMAMLKRATNLRRLQLDGPCIYESDTLAGGAWPPLMQLNWKNSGLTDRSFADLASGNSLEFLEVTGTQLTNRSWDVLDKQPLSRLAVESPHLDDGLVSRLARHTRLGQITLKGGAITDDAIQELSLFMPQLYTLDVEADDLSIVGAATLRDMRGLQLLTLRKASSVDDRWMEILAESHHIRTLTCVDSQVTDAGVKELARISTLEALGLRGSRITDDFFESGIPPHWRKLDLRDTEITDAGLMQLERVLEQRRGDSSGPTLSLHLGGTRVTPQGARSLQRFDFISVWGIEGVKPSDGMPLFFEE